MAYSQRFRVVPDYGKGIAPRTECEHIIRSQLEVIMMAPEGNKEDTTWQAIAARASTETDNATLMSLVAELCHALDRRILRRRASPDGSEQHASITDR